MSADITAARAERLALCDTFEAVGPDAPTLCAPWTSRDLAAHLVIREQRPDLALGIVVPALAGRTERAQEAAARRPYAELVQEVRSGPPIWHPTRLSTIDAAVNTMEFVIHHEDVLRGDGERGPRREVPSFVATATWGALQTMASMLFRRAGVAVDLKAPGRKIIRAGRGPGVVVVGQPVELALLAYGRQQVAEVELTGSEEAVAKLRSASLGV